MHERRWSPVRPVAALARGPDEAPQPAHGRRAMNPLTIAGSGDYGNGHDARNGAPALPLAELLQIVLTHQPDEAVAGIMAGERAQRIDGVARAELRLDRGGADRRTAGEFLGLSKARAKRRHVLARFQGVAGRHQPPDFVQPQRVVCGEADRAVAAMRGVERSAQQADFSRISQAIASPMPALLWRSAVSTVATMPSASRPASAYCFSGLS